MEAFVWNSRFETGIASVDQQHRHLVDIINRLGNVLIDGKAGSDMINDLFGELAKYATYHFTDEERLMAEAGISEQHIEAHRRHHRQFVEQLSTMWKGRTELGNPADVLHGFLSSWLTFHIMEEDQSMARQIALVHQGAAAEDAFLRERQPADKGSAVLLAAMHQLYHVLSLQNKALADTNLRLEEKVEERTRELLQSEKMAAVGQLAAGVAHEINNPIGFVNANLGTLGRYTAQLLAIADGCAEHAARHPDSSADLEKILAENDLHYLREDMEPLLKESLEGLDRVRRIVGSLMDFAQADGETTETDLLAGLEDAQNLAGNEIRHKAEVVRKLSPLPPVRCVPGQIKQVFVNLLINAAQAIEDRGTITLESGVDGDEVWITIADDGCGMTEEVKKRLFEPFFTTRPIGKGTGLGLTVSWDIVVNKHGGCIEVESEPGHGTRFTIRLPIGQPA
jgi:hemerythrin-like metal-binding protein